jgi:hypothetical protein
MTQSNAKQTSTPLTADELNRLIIADRQRRIEAVRAGIQAVLEAQNCQLQATPQIADGLIVAMIQIVPNVEASK